MPGLAGGGKRRRRPAPAREAGAGRVEYKRIPLGKLLHRVPTGHLVARMEPSRRPPKLGVKVVDSNGREVGVLADIIGPVSEPFAVIRPSNGSGDIEEGAELYALIPVSRGSRPRRRPRGGGRRSGRDRGRGGPRKSGRKR